MKKIEELLKDKDIMKVSESAASSFRGSLTEDEIQNCIYNAVWRASKMYDLTKGTKLTSYIHKGVKFECLSQKKINSSGNIPIDRVNNIASKKHNGFERVDMMDEISKCEDPMLIYDRFYRNMTVNEIADNLGVCGETVRIRLRKNLKMIKNSLTGS
jgi:DNA-directed RNA polymerase specialized sigma subunit